VEGQLEEHGGKGDVNMLPTSSVHTGWFCLYKYIIADPLCLDACRPQLEHKNKVLSGITTPLHLEEWVDVEAPYCLLPVHPQDHLLQAAMR